MARPARRKGNLPAETASFVGRRRTLAEIRKRFTEARLVTLAGPGGVGKTRLAVQAAAELNRGFRDGAWLVELAEVGDPALVSDAVMTALGLRDQASTDPLTLLLSYLADTQLLLVVDNCEHLLEAAARLVTDVMRAAPEVRVLTTSREPLSVPGEHVLGVPPLELPAHHIAEPLELLRRNEAVMLFTERAAAASGAFELTEANQATVAELCRRLDGLPLAIELAAVRTRVLSAGQVLERLADRFSLLTGGGRGALPRHQTLRTTIEWSHDLLSEADRALLRRTHVFAGKFTLDDVESVCAGGVVAPEAALDLLSSLVDKSLIARDDANGLVCYRLHETMREFAGIKLRESGEEEITEARCAEHYLVAGRRPTVAGNALPEWLAWAELEIDNVRAVLQRCLARADVSVGLGLTSSVAWYWMTHATTEGIRWLTEFLALGGGDPESRAWCLFFRGLLAVIKADREGAGPALYAAVAAARELGMSQLLTQALSMASIAELMAGDLAAARRRREEAARTITGEEDPPGRLAVLQARAFGGLFEADLEAVRAAATEGADLARRAGDVYRLEVMLVNLGVAAILAGDFDDVLVPLTEAAEIIRQIDDRVAQIILLDVFSGRAILTGQAGLGARLAGASESARAEAGANVFPFLAPLLARASEIAAAALGSDRFEAEVEAGRRLDLDTALRLALGQADQQTAAGAEHEQAASDAPLGKREAEVARLLADGLTNRQVGARLFISERTVDSHVRSILTKLGFQSRAQIAAWMAAPDRASAD